MLKIKKIDHVAIVVNNLDETAARFEKLFGLSVTDRESVASQQAETAHLAVGETSIELVEPRGNESLRRFLSRRGQGIHHIGIEVEDIDSALALLKALGVQLITDTPQVGCQGHKVAFIHPKSTGGVLIELIETGASHACDKSESACSEQG